MTRLEVFEALPQDPYYGPRLAAIPEKWRDFISVELRETETMSLDAFVIYVRGLFLDDEEKPRCWIAVDEIMMVCGSKANVKRG